MPKRRLLYTSLPTKPTEGRVMLRMIVLCAVCAIPFVCLLVTFGGLKP